MSIMNEFIKLKMSNTPITKELLTTIPIPETDMDIFPYTRFYRGQYDKTFPVIYNRRAGVRPRLDCECPRHTEIVIPRVEFQHCINKTRPVVAYR